MANEEQEIEGTEDLTSKPAGMLELDATENAAAEPAQEDVTDEPDAQSTNTVEATLPVEAPSDEPAPVVASDDAPVESVTHEEIPVETPSEEAPVDNELPADAEVPSTVAETETVEEPEAVVDTPEAVVDPGQEPAIETPEEPAGEPVMETPEEPVGEPVMETPEVSEVVAEEAISESVGEASEVAGEPVAESATEAIEPSVVEEITAHYEAETEAAEEEEAAAQPSVDYSQFTKADFVALLQNQLNAISAETVTPGNFKRADATLKEVKPLFDQLKQGDRQAALAKYIEENGSEEGFEFKNDEDVQQFDVLYKQIKSQKNTYFQNLDKAKDSNFATKTELLRRLRELVESEETNAADPKASWNEFKQVQDEWKAAGNINSPHNATLWATYHAIVDRYYSNRNIYFELKELDRKRNATLKAEVIQRVETMASELADKPVSRQTIDDANALFEEYKHIGPAPKADQEVLWGRMKVALDSLYERRRGQTEEQRKESAHLYEEKSKIYEELIPFTTFSSSSINDWNDKTKEVMGIQDRWNAVKGSMPREEGKESVSYTHLTLPTKRIV